MHDDSGGRILHLTTRSEWEASQDAGFYVRSTRDRSLEDVGFIHCSLPSQLKQVAEFVYGDCQEDLVVLVLDLSALEESGLPVRFEDGGNGTLYPHIYAPLPRGLVLEVLPASIDRAGVFHVEG